MTQVSKVVSLGSSSRSQIFFSVGLLVMVSCWWFHLVTALCTLHCVSCCDSHVSSTEPSLYWTVPVLSPSACIISILFRIHSLLGISLISQHVPPGVYRISQTIASHATLDTSSIMQLLGLNGFISSLKSEDGWVELTDQQCVMVSC